MQTITNRVALALTVLTGAGTATAQDLNVKWDNAIKIQSQDKQFDFKIGGRIHHDWAFISNDAALGLPATDGAEMRRARLYLQGTIWGNVEMKAQYDFEDGMADFKDVYVGLKGLPGGNGKLRIGQYKEPAGLEELTSSNNITFMERSVANSLTPSRQTGISYRGAYGEKKAENLTYQVGVFRNTDAFGDADASNAYNISARVTGLPMQNKEKKQFVHAGASLSLREFDTGGVRVRNNREIHLGNRLLDTGTIADAEDGFTYGVEAAYVQGPLSFQGEWLSASIDSPSTMDPTLNGWYVMAAYTITGESRSYKTYDGVFGSVKPATNYGKDGNGAFEVAARYSMADYTDVPGLSTNGEVTSITVGANWYLNPNARVMGNYVISERDGTGAGTGEESAVQFRFQVNF